MNLASSSDGSPVSFLSVMLFRALCALDAEIDKSVVAHVQHQYRPAINAPLNRHSLVSYIPIELLPKIKDRHVEFQNTIIRGQIIIGSEPENDSKSVNRLISVFRNDMSLSEKQSAMRQYIDNSIRGKTFGISYVGKLDWCGMDKYVEDLHAYIGEKNTKNMLLIEVMTVGEDFSINFMQSGRGTRYVNGFIEQIKNFNIPINLVGEERYTLCNTKIPQ
jgi:cobalamin biosynthesis Co2+ chelatase CbiK